MVESSEAEFYAQSLFLTMQAFMTPTVVEMTAGQSQAMARKRPLAPMSFNLDF